MSTIPTTVECREVEARMTKGEWLVVPPSREHPSRAMVCAGGVNIYDAPLTDETNSNAAGISFMKTHWLAMVAQVEENARIRKMLESTTTLLDALDKMEAQVESLTVERDDLREQLAAAREDQERS
jgi:hypothetical protein